MTSRAGNSSYQLISLQNPTISTHLLQWLVQAPIDFLLYGEDCGKTYGVSKKFLVCKNLAEEGFSSELGIQTLEDKLTRDSWLDSQLFFPWHFFCGSILLCHVVKVKTWYLRVNKQMMIEISEAGS